MENERIAKILEWLAERITKAENFIIEQAPDVVQQIITMDVVVGVLALIGCVIAIVACVGASLFAWKMAKNGPDEWCIVHMGSAALVAICIAGICTNTTKVAKAYYAPKAYLLERVGVLK